MAKDWDNLEVAQKYNNIPSASYGVFSGSGISTDSKLSAKFTSGEPHFFSSNQVGIFS